MGTLFRTALAFGWDLICMIGGCDPFNDKALRASKGAIFRIPYLETSWSKISVEMKTRGITLLAADLKGESVHKMNFPDKVSVVLGNEAQGVSMEILKECIAVTIPMKGEMESLNVAVAGGIIMDRIAAQGEL